MEKLELLDDRHCFACGMDNPHGLRIKWKIEGMTMTAHFTPKQKVSGMEGHFTWWHYCHTPRRSDDTSRLCYVRRSCNSRNDGPLRQTSGDWQFAADPWRNCGNIETQPRDDEGIDSLWRNAHRALLRYSDQNLTREILMNQQLTSSANRVQNFLIENGFCAVKELPIPRAQPKKLLMRSDARWPKSQNRHLYGPSLGRSDPRDRVGLQPSRSEEKSNGRRDFAWSKPMGNLSKSASDLPSAAFLSVTLKRCGRFWILS